MEKYKTLDILKHHKDHYYSISIGLFIKHGSKNESEKKTGITHFIEHMLFRTNLKNKHSTKIVEELGGYINAYTTKEYLCIHGKILSDHQAVLLTTILDIVLYPSFTNADIELEKQVVLNEIWNYENNEEIQCQNNLMNEMLDNHPLSREILGTKDSINNFDMNLLKMEHINILQKNKVLSIAGNIDDEQIHNIISERFIEFPEHPDSPVDSINKIDTYKEVNIKRENQKNVNIISHAFPGIEYSDSNIMLYNILANTLGYGSASILNQTLREKKGLVYNVHCLSYSFEEGGVLLISCSTYKGENLPIITNNLLKMYDSILEKGISIEKFNMMKETLKTQILFNSENPSNIMFDRAKNFLLNIHGYKDIDYKYIEDFKSNIDRLEYSDLNEIIDNTFSINVSTITSTNIV